jgi:hypothetical protein
MLPFISFVDRVKELIEYGSKVVAALGILHGPSHMEVRESSLLLSDDFLNVRTNQVMFCADGPCLVEVGSRCHGGEGSWLPVAQECIGKDRLGFTLFPTSELSLIV